jgi:O-antigen ligase
MTPWLNDDSLIIPKQIVLVCSACFLIPRILVMVLHKDKNKNESLILLVTILIFLQMALVMLFTSAPFEQQFFGRTGRGLGFLTEISLLVFFIVAFKLADFNNLRTLLYFFVTASLISTTYSIMQRFNIDFIEWNTRTNGIIGTLGNPNFQASFAAMTIVPALFYFSRLNRGIVISSLISIPLFLVIYFAQSTQGYVAAILAVSVYLLIFSWYKNRLFFKILSILFVTAFFTLIMGMQNKGLLSSILYKGSVESRGDMYRNTWRLIQDHPWFGIGLDSLGDFYLKYKDFRTVQGVNEFTDHAHNLYLNYAAVGGIPLAVLHLVLVFLVVIRFFIFLRKNNKFNNDVVVLFCMWVCFQAQALISPANISMLVWNSILSGSIIGLCSRDFLNVEKKPKKLNFSFANPFSSFLLIIALMVMYPYFKVDKMQQDSATLGSVELAILSAISYPESTIRYSRIGQVLIESNLAPQALEIGRAAAKFNPNAPSAWGLILVNNLAPREERIKAKNQLIRLDPRNEEIRRLVIP